MGQMSEVAEEPSPSRKPAGRESRKRHECVVKAALSQRAGMKRSGSQRLILRTFRKSALQSNLCLRGSVCVGGWRPNPPGDVLGIPSSRKEEVRPAQREASEGAHVLPSTGKNKLNIARTCAELADMWAKLKRLPPGEARAFADDLEGSRFVLPEAQWVAFKAALDAPAKDIPALR